jgi:hypothetical protein
MVDVTVSRTVIRKGPYADFAEKMLGLRNVPNRDSEIWNIEDIRMKELREADVQKLCALSFTTYPENLNTLIKVLSSGVIVDPSAANVLENNLRSQNEISLSDVAFLAAWGHTTEKVDTLFRTVMTDTSFVRVPVLQPKVVEKTLQEKAQDAANQIYNLRDQRFHLLIGDVDSYPEGVALQTALVALKEQEEQLLSLFSGVRVSKSAVYSFSFVPKTPGMGGPVFYFSESRGISYKPGDGLREYYYETIGTDTNGTQTTDITRQDLLYYRFPVLTEITLGSTQGVLIKSLIPVYQFGPLGTLPMSGAPGKR